VPQTEANVDHRRKLQHDGAMWENSTLIVSLVAVFISLASMAFFARNTRRNSTSQYLETEIHNKELKIEDLHQRLQSEIAQKSTLQAELEAVRQSSQEKQQEWEEARSRLVESFQALSKSALESNNQSFLTLAQSQLQKFVELSKKDLELREEKISHLVQPVKESLEKMGTKLQEIERNRGSAEGALKEQVQLLLKTNQDLRVETHGLVAALRAPQARGRWGELQLRRVAEMSGMIAYCDFELQSTQSNEDSQKLRPDMVIRMPGGKQIVVDAKTPLIAFLEATQLSDPDQRRDKMKDHAKHIRKHIDDLSKKSYWQQFQPSPDFVVLFLPGEHFFAAALEADPELIEVGVSQNVIIATPTTLIALLRSASYGWQQERLAENVRQVGKIGQELYRRVADMSEHFVRLGKNLNQSVDAYNRAMGTLESRVLVSARKMNELNGLTGKDEIPELFLVETQARQLTTPESEGPGQI
jgi:DNA recombination protein RmuC